MPKYYVDVLIGTSYTLVIDASNDMDAQRIAWGYDPNGNDDPAIEDVEEGECAREILHLSPAE